MTAKVCFPIAQHFGSPWITCLCCSAVLGFNHFSTYLWVVSMFMFHSLYSCSFALWSQIWNVFQLELFCSCWLYSHIYICGCFCGGLWRRDWKCYNIKSVRWLARWCPIMTHTWSRYTRGQEEGITKYRSSNQKSNQYNGGHLLKYHICHYKIFFFFFLPSPLSILTGINISWRCRPEPFALLLPNVRCRGRAAGSALSSHH